MRSPSFTTRSSVLAVMLLIVSSTSLSQRISILAPDASAQNKEILNSLRSALAKRVTVLDEMLAASAFNASSPQHPFNQTTEEAEKLGSAIGCDFMILVRSATLRRSSSERSEFYEAYAAIFAVSSRSGRLISFDLLRHDAARSAAATDLLKLDVEVYSHTLAEKMKDTAKAELTEQPRPQMEEVPDVPSPPKGFRAPIPYLRIKPVYTPEAGYYDIAATVDIEVDLRADGTIAATRITRWAGYGLDESVDQTVRKMNWRPAERAGRSIPMRFMLRYNFKRLDKEPE